MGKISREGNKCITPDVVTIPYIEGDGIGEEITSVYQSIVDAAIRLAYRGKRFIKWKEILAGRKAFAYTDELLPQETINILKEYVVAIKGPLAPSDNRRNTSIDNDLYNELDLYTSWFPVTWFPGVTCSLRKPERLNMDIFRENGGGHEKTIHAAFEYAIKNRASNVTFLHDGLEEDMLTLGYRIADFNYSEHTFSMKVYERLSKLWGIDGANEELEKAMLGGKIIVKDTDRETFIQTTLKYPEEYAVVVSLNSTGGCVLDEITKLAGCSNIVPCCRINSDTGYALFEPTYDQLCNYTETDQINPTSMILSAAMMLEYIGWTSASRLIIDAMEFCFSKGLVTKDMKTIMPGSKSLSTSEFRDVLLDNLGVKIVRAAV